MKKRLALMIIFILIMAFSFTTLAADRSFVAKYVFGGSSQELDTGFRSSDDEVSFDITDVTNYQTG
ncbi:MAG TPA: hypothetical protein PKA81_14220 [Clostridia bacterium]|nr:hypothetical protein [Clostridia bacterium]